MGRQGSSRKEGRKRHAKKETRENGKKQEAQERRRREGDTVTHNHTSITNLYPISDLRCLDHTVFSDGDVVEDPSGVIVECAGGEGSGRGKKGGGFWEKGGGMKGGGCSDGGIRKKCIPSDGQGGMEMQDPRE